MKAKVYTDGACSGNPGPGGWGCVVISVESDNVFKLSGFEVYTTNNKMELMGAIEGLRFVKNYSFVEVYTDSMYVKNGITSWINSWKKNGWRTASREPVKNADLWMELDLLASELNVNWNWVKGHAGDVYNNMADKLARDEILKAR